MRSKTDVLCIGKGKYFVRIDKLTIFFGVLTSLVLKIWERNSIVMAELPSEMLYAVSSSKSQVMVIVES